MDTLCPCYHLVNCTGSKHAMKQAFSYDCHDFFSFIDTMVLCSSKSLFLFKRHRSTYPLCILEDQKKVQHSFKNAEPLDERMLSSSPLLYLPVNLLSISPMRFTLAAEPPPEKSQFSQISTRYLASSTPTTLSPMVMTWQLLLFLDLSVE